MPVVPVPHGSDRRAAFTLFRNSRVLFAVAAGLIVVLIAGSAFVRANWPYSFRKIHPMLEDVFSSQVKISNYHRTYFPHPGFVAIGLTLRRKSAPDLPPLGSVEKLEVQGRWTDLLLLRRRVGLVEVTGLHVVVPPLKPRQSGGLPGRKCFGF
jgi:hypothetical protein